MSVASVSRACGEARRSEEKRELGELGELGEEAGWLSHSHVAEGGDSSSHTLLVGNKVIGTHEDVALMNHSAKRYSRERISEVGADKKSTVSRFVASLIFLFPRW